jgi:hypothetical protein
VSVTQSRKHCRVQEERTIGIFIEFERRNYVAAFWKAGE